MDYCKMAWCSVDSQRDLTHFNQLTDWGDADVVEFYANHGHEPFFPQDVCRSGWDALNIYLLYDAPFRDVKFIEIALIHCEWFTFGFLHRPFFGGKVDALRRVEVLDYQGSMLMRCARLIYRVHGRDTSIRRGHLARQFAPVEETV